MRSKRKAKYVAGMYSSLRGVRVVVRKSNCKNVGEGVCCSMRGVCVGVR